MGTAFAQAGDPPARRPADGVAASRSVTFLHDVMPLLNARGCNAAACHGAATGKGGFKLSLFGADSEQDYAALTKSARGRRINRVEPDKSLLLLKVTAQLEHGGKQKIAPKSPAHALLRLWIERGAPWADDEQPQLRSVEITPAPHRLEKGGTQPMQATAVYTDGTRKDVTHAARYTSTAEDVAAVSEAGEVEARGYGETYIIVTYLRRSAMARIVVPQPLSFLAIETNCEIDRLVGAKLEELGFPPAALCSDEAFLRRVFLDVIGLLPTPDEARAFLADPDTAKRAKLIDRLLTRDEFADYWALKWGDLLRIKSEYPINLWPNAVQAYHRWVRDSIASNKPYDQFVRELLTASGSNFRSPPANYYRALRKRDAQGFAEVTALVFMGARIGCARCHGHPQERWTLDDNLGLAAFFAQVRFKRTQEWKEEVVYVDPRRVLYHPTTRVVVKPQWLGGAAPEIGVGQDAREAFADWLTAKDNRWFARNIVNRIWYWLLGRGIVHEPDDMRPTNPPANEPLLAYLERELKDHEFDTKHIFRLILNAQTYQRSSKATAQNRSDAAQFSHYAAKRLGAESLLDAICQVTETSEKYSSRIPEPFSNYPAGYRATQLPDGSVGSAFLELFGRPPRDTPYESDRCLDTSMRQALHLINSSHLEGKIVGSPRIKRLLKAGKSDTEIVEEIYLAALSRPPTGDEKQKLVAYIAKKKKARTQAIQDVLWAVLNAKEFLFVR